MRSDLDIKRDVEDELISDPDVVATDVGVAVKDGVVTVTGFVRSFRQRRTPPRDIRPDNRQYSRNRSDRAASTDSMQRQPAIEAHDRILDLLSKRGHESGGR
jgi:hypothetical protein